jgi:hypothetical protein
MIPRRQGRSLHSKILLTAFLLAGLTSGQAWADVTFGASGSDTDGPISGTVTFSAGPGVLNVTLTNTQPNGSQMHLGQGLSDVSFTYIPPTGLSNQPTALSALSGVGFDATGLAMGTAWTLASGTPFSGSPTSSSPPGLPTHWVFNPSGFPVTTLATANVGGGAPNMIFPSSGIVEDGLSNGNQNPLYIGPTIFQLTVPDLTAGTNLTAANFSNVTLSFGTAPDATLPAGVVPEPSTLAIAGLGALGFIGYGLRRRLKK